MDVCSSRCNGDTDRSFYYQFPGNKSSDCKSSEKFENGIINVRREKWNMNNSPVRLADSHYITCAKLLIMQFKWKPFACKKQRTIISVLCILAFNAVMFLVRVTIECTSAIVKYKIASCHTITEFYKMQICNSCLFISQLHEEIHPSQVLLLAQRISKMHLNHVHWM